VPKQRPLAGLSRHNVLTQLVAGATLLTWLESQHIELGFSRGSPEIIARLDHFGLLKDAEVYRTDRDVIAALADAHRD
jgi:hypothetical protein